MNDACGKSGALCSRCSVGEVCGGFGNCITPGGTGGTGGGNTGGTGGGQNSSYPVCSSPDDCPNWYCNCRTGPPVNSRRCVNNRCQDGAQACPSACAGFGTCWLGTAGGGFTGGTNVGPSTCTSGTGGGGGSSGETCSHTDLGKGCELGSECQSGLCYGISPSFICTKGCTQSSDCPYNWVCASVTGGGNVCMTGALTTATRSTSRVCSAVVADDVGAPCGNCDAKFCVGGSCTRRCDGSADCPSTWSCIDNGSFRYCAP